MNDGALTTEQARALGAPRRQAIVTYLAEADRPVTVAELTDHLGCNHNAVRKHLAQLVDAGLVVEAREARVTPGRPKLLYRLAPDAATGVDLPYRRLAVLLATALATGDDPAEVGRRAMVPVGSVANEAETPIDALAEYFAAEGFDPAVRRRGRRTELVLQHCPFAAAAEANPAGVCRLHLGLAEGAVDAIGGLAVDGLVPKDPRQAGCRLMVHEVTEAGA